MKFEQIMDIIYFIILQISYGFMFWFLYSILPCFKTLLPRFIVIIIFVVAIVVPNFYISKTLFKNRKNVFLEYMEICITILICGGLLYKFGPLVITFK